MNIGLRFTEDCQVSSPGLLALPTTHLTFHSDARCDLVSMSHRWGGHLCPGNKCGQPWEGGRVQSVRYQLLLLDSVTDQVSGGSISQEFRSYCLTHFHSGATVGTLSPFRKLGLWK